MALKNVAVQGMTLLLSDPTVVATVSIVDPPSSKVKAETKGVYRDGAQVSVSAITVPSAGATVPDPGPYVVPLNATAAKVRAESDLVLRIDDESDTINAVPQIPGTPPVAYPVSFTVRVSVAGQSKVKAQ
jgi:hypothetical protein